MYALIWLSVCVTSLATSTLDAVPPPIDPAQDASPSEQRTEGNDPAPSPSRSAPTASDSSGVPTEAVGGGLIGGSAGAAAGAAIGSVALCAVGAVVGFVVTGQLLMQSSFPGFNTGLLGAALLYFVWFGGTVAGGALGAVVGFAGGALAGGVFGAMLGGAGGAAFAYLHEE